MLTIIADDLSGAQEAFAAATGLAEAVVGSPGLLALSAHAVPAGPVGPVAVDLDARSLGPEAAAQALRRALSVLRDRGRDPDGTVLKLDSLVRGPVPALVGVLAESAPVVLCPAIPALKRTVIDGTIHLDGIPLDATDHWHLEPVAPPRDLTQLFASQPTSHLGLSAVRAAHPRPHLARALEESRIVLADAETDEDCRAIAQAAHAAGAVLAGAAGVVRAAGALRASAQPSVDATAAGIVDAPVTVVVGSAALSAQAQVDVLAADGIDVLSWAPGCRLPAADRRDRVILLDTPVDPARSAALNDEFTTAVAAAAGRSHLVLTGGQTARAVLDRLGIGVLRPLSQPHHGAVTAVSDDGRLVTTRPGSFGERDSLRTILDSLATALSSSTGGTAS